MLRGRPKFTRCTDFARSKIHELKIPKSPVLPSAKAEAVVIAPEGSDAETPAVEQPADRRQQPDAERPRRSSSSSWSCSTRNRSSSRSSSASSSATRSRRSWPHSTRPGFRAASAPLSRSCCWSAALGLGIYTLSDQAMAIVERGPAGGAAHSRAGADEPIRSGRRLFESSAGGDGNRPGGPGGVGTDGCRTGGGEAGQGADGHPEGRSRATRPSAPAITSGLADSASLGFAGQFVLVLFLVYFFLVTGDLYKRKVVKIAGPTLTEKKITVKILDDINLQIASFMRVQVFTSVLVAVATALALWWFGVRAVRHLGAARRHLQFNPLRRPAPRHRRPRRRRVHAVQRSARRPATSAASRSRLPASRDSCSRRC